MARIRSFEPSTQDVNRHPTEVDCQYQSFLDNGVRLHDSSPAPVRIDDLSVKVAQL